MKNVLRGSFAGMLGGALAFGFLVGGIHAAKSSFSDDFQFLDDVAILFGGVDRNETGDVRLFWDQTAGTLKLDDGTNVLLTVTDSGTTGRLYVSGTGGIGTTSPDGTFHVHSGSAGAFTANPAIDDFVVEHSGDGGITIKVPNNNISRFALGSPSSSSRAKFQLIGATSVFSVGNQEVGGSTVLMADNQIGSITLSGASGSELAEFASRIVTTLSGTARAFFNLPHGAAPTSPVDGDVWTTTAGIFVRINGSTIGPLS